MPAIHRPVATADLIHELFGPEPIPVCDLLAAGVTRGQLDAALRVGTVERVRRGVVRVGSRADSACLPEVEQNTSTSDRELERASHLPAAKAALMRLGDDSTVSHGSSALLHRVPTFEPPPLNVWVTAPRHGHVIAGVHARLGELSPEDITEVDGIRCTSLARTALDLARRRPLHQSLVVLDAALARIGREPLESAFARLTWQRDRRLLREAIDHADALSESALESISRGRFLEARLPRPELQSWIACDDGRRYRVDFLWRAQGVIGEADGAVKYQTRENLIDEKRREDALRRAGFTVVRWTYPELRRTPDAVIARLRRAGAATTPLLRP